MNTWSVSMVKDECDVIEALVAHHLDEVDGMLIADNGSTDGTRDLLADLEAKNPGRVVVVDDPDPAYYQSIKTTALAHQARERFGATWIVPIDADECWYSRGDRISVVLESMPPAVGLVEATLYNHFATGLDADADPVPFRRMEWRQRVPGVLPKVAVRWHPDLVIAQGNHDATHTGGRNGGLELRHFPYRSFQRMADKARAGAAAYAATDLPYDQGAHWRGYAEILERHGEAALREVWERYFYFLSPLDGGLIRDPAPWCRWR